MAEPDYTYDVKANGPWLTVTLDREPPHETVYEIVTRLQKLERGCMIETENEIYWERMHPVPRFVGYRGGVFEIMLKYSILAGKCSCDICQDDVVDELLRNIRED